MCPDCSHELNFFHKKKEVVKKKKKQKKEKKRRTFSKSDEGIEKGGEDEQKAGCEENEVTPAPGSSKDEASTSCTTDIWRETQILSEEKSRDEEFEEYLQDLMF